MVNNLQTRQSEPTDNHNEHFYTSYVHFIFYYISPKVSEGLHRVVRGDSLSLGQLLGGDLLCLLAAHHQVVASGNRAYLRGIVGFPEGDLSVQSSHSQLLAIGSIGHGQSWESNQFSFILTERQATVYIPPQCEHEETQRGRREEITQKS